VPEPRSGMGEGDEFAGKYRIERLLGAGAMGQVYAAHHLLLDRRVAIKFLVPESIGRAEATRRFVREARAAARLESEHVVRVLDVAVESDVPYIVMEYLEGRDLAAWLRTKGPLPVEQAVDFVLQACDALHEAHGLDIIHRDIKPPNLFAVERPGAEPIIKVLDFGISKTTEFVPATVRPDEWSQDGVVTEDRMTIGSPQYMSPEQMESSHDVDARTDVWALGVTLHELLSGKRPFEGASPVQVYASILMPAPLRLREHAPGVPVGLEAIVARCLQRNRDRRYRNVAELALALAGFGSSRSAACVERMRRSVRPWRAAPVDPTPNTPPLDPVPNTPRSVLPPSSQGAEKTLASHERVAPERVANVERPRRRASGLLVAAAIAAGLLGAVRLSTPPPEPGVPASVAPSQFETVLPAPSEPAQAGSLALPPEPGVSAPPLVPVAPPAPATTLAPEPATATPPSLSSVTLALSRRVLDRPPPATAAHSDLGASDGRRAPGPRAVRVDAGDVSAAAADWTPPEVPK
jgi:serine/threonine protein kinase